MRLRRLSLVLSVRCPLARATRLARGRPRINGARSLVGVRPFSIPTMTHQTPSPQPLAAMGTPALLLEWAYCKDHSRKMFDKLHKFDFDEKTVNVEAANATATALHEKAAAIELLLKARGINDPSVRGKRYAPKRPKTGDPGTYVKGDGFVGVGRLF